MRALATLLCVVALASALSPSLTRRQSLSVCGGLCGGLVVPVVPARRREESVDADGVTAFAGIVEARKVLDKVEQLIKTDKYDDAKTLLESGSVAAFESNAMALVASPALAAEDKRSAQYGATASALTC